ncbi:MAG: hypothetical protein AAFQ94_30080 [Bacteroidota bacterium]
MKKLSKGTAIVLILVAIGAIVSSKLIVQSQILQDIILISALGTGIGVLINYLYFKHFKSAVDPN